MAADRHDGDSTRELRLEGIGLLLGGGFLLALIVGAFFLGRWVERQTGPLDAQTPDGGGPLAQVAAREPDADAAEGLTYFDTLEGTEKEVETGREMPAQTPPPPTASSQQAAVAEPAAQVDDGRFYVQVLALRDQYAAAEVIESLKAKGYGVRLFPEREGQGTLYKVRVGGYATREEATAARDSLRRAGHPGAFVWPAG
jgi:septal ring-binding cell division protein DamX